MKKERIVSSGMCNLRDSPATRQRIDQAVAEIKAKYEPGMKQVGLIRRLVLWFMMKKAIRAEIEKIVPSKGCYISR